MSGLQASHDEAFDENGNCDADSFEQSPWILAKCRWRHGPSPRKGRRATMRAWQEGRAQLAGPAGGLLRAMAETSLASVVGSSEAHPA